MQDETEWLPNRRALKLGLVAASALVVLMFLAGTFVPPLIGAPSWTWIGLVIISVFGVIYLLRLQPATVRISGNALQVHWIPWRTSIPLDRVREAVFLVDKKYLELDWARRFYSLHVFLIDGRRVVVGGLDGPIAREISRKIPASRVRLKVYSGSQLVGERMGDKAHFDGSLET